MAEDANPYIALLNEIGNPISPLKLQRMFRKALITEKKTIPELESQIKQLARGQPERSEEAQRAWNQKFSDLMDKAATRTTEHAKADDWEALRAATGDAITIVDLQSKFRTLWNPERKTWFELPIQTRSQLFQNILDEISQRKNILPSDPEELAVFENTLHSRIDAAGKKSWSLMKRSRAKKRRMEGEGGSGSGGGGGGGGRAGSQTSSRGASDGETGETGETA